MPDIDTNGFLGDKINIWMANHRNRHAALFNVILDLNQECHCFLSVVQVDNSNTLHITTTALFSRLLELFQGIVITVEHGMVSVGRVLSRAHLEAFFKFMAIHKDRTFLQQYLNQSQFNRKRLVKNIVDANDPSLDTLQKELDPNLPQRIDEIIKQQHIKDFTIK